jgi:hypothetical protein
VLHTLLAAVAALCCAFPPLGELVGGLPAPARRRRRRGAVAVEAGLPPLPAAAAAGGGPAAARRRRAASWRPCSPCSSRSRRPRQRPPGPPAAPRAARRRLAAACRPRTARWRWGCGRPGRGRGGLPGLGAHGTRRAGLGGGGRRGEPAGRPGGRCPRAPPGNPRAAASRNPSSGVLRGTRTVEQLYHAPAMRVWIGVSPPPPPHTHTHEIIQLFQHHTLGQPSSLTLLCCLPIPPRRTLPSPSHPAGAAAALPLPSRPGWLAPAPHGRTHAGLARRRAEDEPLFQLTRLFAYLGLSYRSAPPPVALIHSINNAEGRPTPLNVQQERA